jgi:putative transposase
MAEVGEPTQYGYAERLMRTIKEEVVDLSEYRDYHKVDLSSPLTFICVR